MSQRGLAAVVRRASESDEWGPDRAYRLLYRLSRPTNRAWRPAQGLSGTLSKHHRVATVPQAPRSTCRRQPFFPVWVPTCRRRGRKRRRLMGPTGPSHSAGRPCRRATKNSPPLHRTTPPLGPPPCTQPKVIVPDSALTSWPFGVRNPHALHRRGASVRPARSHTPVTYPLPLAGMEAAECRTAHTAHAPLLARLAGMAPVPGGQPHRGARLGRRAAVSIRRL